MDSNRTATLVAASLAALVGLVLGAAIMLLTLEARDDGETEAEERIEELFTLVTPGGAVRYDFVFDELPPRFPRTFPQPPSSDLRGGFELDVGDGTLSGFAMYRVQLDSAELQDFFRDAATERGWEAIEANGGATPFGIGQVFCLSPGKDRHSSIVVRALNAEDGRTDLTLQYEVGSQEPGICRDRSSVGLRTTSPRIAAAFSAVRFPGARLGQSSSTGISGDLATWSSTLIVDGRHHRGGGDGAHTPGDGRP